MTESLTGKSIFITGAASGIGEACVRLATRRGARVLMTDIDDERGAAVAEALRCQGGDCEYRHCDVAREDDVRAAVEAAVARFGRLDCAVNNAGTAGVPAALEDIDIAEWQRVVAINLTSVFLCMKHQLPVMKAQGAGAIVNVASGAGLIAAPHMSPYTATKHGVLGLTKTAVAENVRSGVRINAVLPGSTRTPMLEQSMQASPEVERMIMASVPCGRLAEPAEIAEAILWLCSDAASYVSGESLVVDNGTVSR